MNVSLSWDLFVIVFFIVIVAYSLIIGRNNTLKVILGTYVAMVAADASGFLFGKYFMGSQIFMKILSLASVGNEQEAIILVKILVFVTLVILFAVKGAFEVDTVDDRSATIRMVLSLVYAFMSAGLIISAILVIVSGSSSLVASSGGVDSTSIWGIYNRSNLVGSIVNNSALWFSVPALAFLLHSFYSSKE